MAGDLSIRFGAHRSLGAGAGSAHAVRMASAGRPASSPGASLAWVISRVAAILTGVIATAAGLLPLLVLIALALAVA